MRSLKIGFVGNFGVSYSTESDRAWTFRKLGHNVIEFQENTTTFAELAEVVMNKKIDVLFYSHTHGYEIKDLITIFAHCQLMGIPTVSVHLDRFAWLKRETDVGKEATWFTQYLFMADGSPEAVELYEKHKLNWHWLKPGVIERDCYLAEPDNAKFPHEVIFVGSRGYHPEYPNRPKLIEFLQQVYGKRFGHYGGDGLGTIREHDLNVLYASAKVVVGDSCFGGRPKYWSDRVTETMGRGGFLIHPKCDGLEIPGMVDYESGNFVQLKTIIDSYLTDEPARLTMRNQSQEWVKNNETYTNRSLEIFKVIYGL